MGINNVSSIISLGQIQRAMFAQHARAGKDQPLAVYVSVPTRPLASGRSLAGLPDDGPGSTRGKLQLTEIVSADRKADSFEVFERNLFELAKFAGRKRKGEEAFSVDANFPKGYIVAPPKGRRPSTLSNREWQVWVDRGVAIRISPITFTVSFKGPVVEELQDQNYLPFVGLQGEAVYQALKQGKTPADGLTALAQLIAETPLSDNRRVMPT